MSYPMITAHSGCEGIVRDSIDSVRKGVELKTEAVEVDVRLGKDGVLYLSHDDRDDYSGADTLEDAFRFIAENELAINCDLKQTRVLFPVLDLADKCGIPQRKLIFSGDVDLAELAWHPEIAKRARIFLNAEHVYGRFIFDRCSDPVEALRSPGSLFDKDCNRFLKEESRRMADFYKAIGAECMNICYHCVDHEIIEIYSALGIPISVWTVNDPEEQRRFLHEKVFNITTMQPVSALKIRNEKV